MKPEVNTHAQLEVYLLSVINFLIRFVLVIGLLLGKMVLCMMPLSIQNTIF